MGSNIEARLAEKGIIIPGAAAPAANYVPYIVTGNLVFVAGQVPFENGEIRRKGIVGRDLDLEEAQESARICALNLVAQVKAACGGDLDRVVRVVKLGGFVACTAEFNDHPKVINGASDLMVDVFGAAGQHARFAVGASSLPLGVPVEIDGIFEIQTP